MDPEIDVCQTEQPQISYSVDFTAEQSSAMGLHVWVMGSPILLDREGSVASTALPSPQLAFLLARRSPMLLDRMRMPVLCP